MKKIKVTLKKSLIDKIQKHKLTLKALGLTRIGKSRIYHDNPALRGMLTQIAFMIETEETTEPATKKNHRRPKPHKEKQNEA